MKKPIMLMILDGFGLSKKVEGNAIAQADAPELKAIMTRFPHGELSASGIDVGLPEGQMGNSEVGHLNIGAGRVVYQELTKISKAIKDGTFYKNPVLIEAMKNVKEKGSTLHLFGLVSDGGVHSHLDHVKALIKMAKQEGVKDLSVECFLDGRDVPPRSAKIFLDSIQDTMNQESLGRINYISGRYYAMDRDKRWDRVEKAYEALTLGEGLRAETYSQAIEKAYERGENDEFILPTVVGSLSLVSEGDSVIFFNFRPDRARELTRSFVDPSFHGFFRKKVVEDLTFVCMCQYDITLPNVMVAYPPEMLLNTLGEYLSANGKTQLRIAETEKYAHVTFFFNGGVEIPNPGEDRVLIPSPQVATYDLQPEMSAFLVRDRVLDELTEDNYDLIILNFANADMVGHTGKMDAAIKAIETLGLCVPPVVDKVLELGGEVLITADHGNAERMLDEEGNIVTSHSTNPVPIVHVAKNPKEIRVGGRLCDLAPTLLEMMGLPIPIEMTGTSLFKK